LGGGGGDNRGEKKGFFLVGAFQGGGFWAGALVWSRRGWLKIYQGRFGCVRKTRGGLVGHTFFRDLPRRAPAEKSILGQRGSGAVGFFGGRVGGGRSKVFLGRKQGRFMWGAFVGPLKFQGQCSGGGGGGTGRFFFFPDALEQKLGWALIACGAGALHFWGGRFGGATSFFCLLTVCLNTDPSG